MGALDQLRGDQGILGRARSNSRIAVAIAAGAILLLAWIGWAIYVTSSKGGTAGLGVVIAWPAMLAAVALVSLPFVGGYVLLRRLSGDSGSAAREASDEPEEVEAEDAAEDEDPAEEEGRDEGEEADDEGEEEGDGDSDEEANDDSESDSEPEASKAG